MRFEKKVVAKLAWLVLIGFFLTILADHFIGAVAYSDDNVTL
jgi:hypothetical protein